MSVIYIYFDNIDSYAKNVLLGYVEFITGNKLVVMNSLSELKSVKLTQEVIIFVSKLTHGANCFCQYEHLNMKVIDVVDDRTTPCSALRRIINLRQPVSGIFETISRVIKSSHHRTSCYLCHVLNELTPEEKKLIKIIREGKYTTEEMATEIGIGNKIISKHKRKIMSKINIDNSIAFYHWVINMESLNLSGVYG